MKTFSTSEILDRLRSALNQSNDTELANFLGVKKATLSNWRTRNSLDWPLLFSVCEQLDLNWIIYGEATTTPVYENRERPTASNDALIQHLDNQLKSKDKEIGALNKEIGRLEAKVESLKEQLQMPRVFTPITEAEEVSSPPVLQNS